MKLIGILGSTGSIGTQLLDIIGENDLYRVQYLTAKSNVSLLINQALKFKPKKVCIVDSSLESSLADKLKNTNIEILSGHIGIKELSSDKSCDLMVNAIVGYEGMTPTIEAIKKDINVALANKESLVMAGPVIRSLQKKSKSKIFPIDSEHSAIWQCMRGEDINQVQKLILTASGGPFRNLNFKKFKNITVEDALCHPNWEMGNKISIDSATMMNKGFEVIEAYWLFNLDIDKIDIIVHPQSIIHSMVEFIDGSVKAQLGIPDMKIPIQYAITYPNHVNLDSPRLNFSEIKNLSFEDIDTNRFPCISLAYQALSAGGTALVALNVANDISVDLFLNKKIKFVDIPKIIESAIAYNKIIDSPSMNDIVDAQISTEEFIKENLGAITK